MTINRAGSRLKRILAVAAVLWVFFLTGCSYEEGVNILKPTNQSDALTDLSLTVHFIDVGQGDSTLIEADGHFMLIDAGEKEAAPAVVDYLKDQGVKTLDYVIGTHPHSDHIGGLESVIKGFSVEGVMLPDKEHTTRTYEKLLDAIDEKGVKITVPKPGESYSLGNASFQILSPNGDYGDNLNNWSIGIRLLYGETSFVFCGDAEKEAEADMLSNGLKLNADVLKVSHHGSSTSSSPEFLRAVNPRYAVISCGKNNDYGHPHKETLKSLKELGTTVLRTDQLGTIIIKSDGKSIQLPEESKSENQPVDTDKEYIINTNTGKFHLPDCKLAQSMKEKNRKRYKGTRQELIDEGLDPCKSCNP